MAAEQTTDFAAVKGNEYPVDVSANPTVSQLVVTAPATAVANDVFAVFDSRRACDLYRTIVIDFTGGVLHSVPDDHAVINGDGDRIEFVYVNATIGWRVASNIN